MKLELYQYVALLRDVPEQRLKKGDIALLVDYAPHPSGGEDGYILEVFNAVGELDRSDSGPYVYCGPASG